MERGRPGRVLASGYGVWLSLLEEESHVWMWAPLPHSWALTRWNSNGGWLAPLSASLCNQGDWVLHTRIQPSQDVVGDVGRDLHLFPPAVRGRVGQKVDFDLGQWPLPAQRDGALRRIDRLEVSWSVQVCRSRVWGLAEKKSQQKQDRKASNVWNCGFGGWHKNSPSFYTRYPFTAGADWLVLGLEPSSFLVASGFSYHWATCAHLYIILWYWLLSINKLHFFDKSLSERCCSMPSLGIFHFLVLLLILWVSV